MKHFCNQNVYNIYNDTINVIKFFFIITQRMKKEKNAVELNSPAC